jgi:hypothetical protein
VDSLAAQAGHAEAANVARIGVTWQWDRQWFTEGHWHLTGYWEASLGYWEGQGGSGRTLWDVGLAPVFRLRPNASGGTQPYLDAALGAHKFSSARLDASHDLDTALQIAQKLGLGVTFGDKTRYDLSYRLERLTGEDITSHQVRLSYLF